MLCGKFAFISYFFAFSFSVSKFCSTYNFSVAGDEDHLQVKRNKWRVRMFFGFRF